jgi:hypothetical protein
MSPYGAFNCSDCSWKAPGVAQSLSLLAPRLAPRDLVNFANVRVDENSIDGALERWRSVCANQRRGPELVCPRRAVRGRCRVAPGQPETGNVKNTMASNDMPSWHPLFYVVGYRYSSTV